MRTFRQPRVWLFLATVSVAVAMVVVPAGAQGAGCDILGTSGPDVLVGTDADEVICGLGGDDVIEGGGGDDRLVGGSGNDVLRGGGGRDLLLGGAGDDDLNGQLGADRLNGQRGSDLLQGGPGRDRLLGGPGLDSCADLAGRTRSRSCESGELVLERSQELWDSLDADEYVYSVLVSVDCARGVACIARGSMPTSVFVRPGVATLPDLGSADGLFERAAEVIAEGGSSTFDAETGLPRAIRGPGDRAELVLIRDIQVRDGLRAAYDAARGAWNSQNIDAYSFVFRHVCFCPGIVDVRVEVVGGEVVSATPVGEVDPDAWIPDGQTVDAHLGDIGQLLDGRNISVEAAFDPETGVPLSYGFDVSPLIADEELTVQISDFLPEDSEQPQDERAPEPNGDPEDAAGPGAVVIVDVSGIQVNQDIAEPLAALLDAAAADGFTLSGGGFRDPARQIALRRVNCGMSDYAIWDMPASECSPPTARPGQSLHETGHAVDFTSTGSLVVSRTDPAFLWLTANAATHGFFNLPTEPWHWSINGN